MDEGSPYSKVNKQSWRIKPSLIQQEDVNSTFEPEKLFHLCFNLFHKYNKLVLFLSFFYQPCTNELLFIHYKLKIGLNSMQNCISMLFFSIAV